MKKRVAQTIRLALAGIFMISILVSCVTFERMGKKVDQGVTWSKGKLENAYPASKAAPKAEKQQAAPGTEGATKQMPAKEEAAQYFIHQVKWPNESLSIIAKWYTGSLMNWKALAKANPEMEPTVIHVGDRIRIPVSMLKTRDPMPEKFVDELVQNLKKKSSSRGTKEKQEKQEEEPALFGPKGLSGQ